MKRLQELPRPDLIIIIFLLLMAALAFFALQSQGFLSFLSQGARFETFQLGEIIEAENKVQKKYLHETHWEKAGSEMPIFNQQMLFTNEGSTSKIQLDNESVINLGPETLIVLYKEGNRNFLELRKGEVSGTFKKLNVLVNGKLIRLNSKDSKISVLGDEVSVTHNDQEATIFSPTKFLISEAGATGPYFIKLLNLKKSQYILKESAVKVDLGWKSKGVSRYNLIMKRWGKNEVSVKKIKALTDDFHTLSINEAGKYQVSLEDSETKTVVSNKILFKVFEFPKMKIKNRNIQKKI